MKVAIERIRIDEDSRIRKDLGNLEPLQQSISQVGLINPVLIDEQGKLVAGYRRLSACRNLGWEEIDATVVTLEGDELQMLEVEVAENLHRKDFTPDEILATQKRREQIIESRRKKGWFERFWLWLKNLFGGSPSVSEPTQSKNNKESSPEPAPVEPPKADKQTNPAERDDDQIKANQQETPAQPEEPEQMSNEVRTSVDRAGAHLSGEITEKNGLRHIKWRSS